MEDEVEDDVEVETLPLELDDVEVDVDTFPLDEDEVEVETFPLDDDVLLTFPLDEVLLTLPLEVEEVLLTPPVEVEDDEPPDEVELEDPPDEVELDEPPDEVEVDPPLELEVEETTIPLDPPPPLPPKKPPAKNPPPKPPPNPPPPITTGGALGPALAICGAGGSGTGGVWVETVTTVGSHAGSGAGGRTRGRAATRSTRRFTGFAATFFLLNSVRGLLVSATCTAPPPISAPPAAHAASFAIAIRTDMIRLSIFSGDQLPPRSNAFRTCRSREVQNKDLSARSLTTNTHVPMQH